jgi:hypothetical protein
MVHGPGFLFALIRLCGRQVGQTTPSVRDHETAPALHLARNARGARNEDQGKRQANGQRGGRAWPPSRREGRTYKSGPGGRRKPLIRLDSAKEIQAFSLISLARLCCLRPRFGVDLGWFGKNRIELSRSVIWGRGRSPSLTPSSTRANPESQARAPRRRHSCEPAPHVTSCESA